MLRQEELDRRTLVQGTGAAIALPFLDAMFPALAASSPKSPTRMAFVYVPNGIIMEAWTPGDGRANRPVTREARLSEADVEAISGAAVLPVMQLILFPVASLRAPERN